MGSAAWDDAPAAAVDNSWKSGDGDVGGWKPDTGADDNFTGEFAEANISKHADDAPADGGCRICKADGHFARDCPEKGDNPGGCFNCGQEGHIRAECPEPQNNHFTGDCRNCGQQGHRAADCPDKPPVICKLCKGEGHIGSECNVNRMVSYLASLGIQDEAPEDAWAALVAVDEEKDIDDIKKAIFTYVKAYPGLTIKELEIAFRNSDLNTYLIAKEQEISDVHTIINLQGQKDQKYVVSFQFSTKPKRAAFAEGWPSSPEENLDRLTEAGFIMDALVTKCSRCGELGHMSKQCEQEKDESNKVIISCANCSSEGHRARDCPEPRKSGNMACRNCGSEEHIAKECPEPRSAEGVECKNCGEMGHFSRDCPSKEPELCRNCGEEGHRAKECENERVIKCRNCDGEGHISKDCPEPRNMSKMQCRNCDEFGHGSRDCPKPTDWSRVECTSCHEKGHSYRRCTKSAEAETGVDSGWEGDAGAASGGGGGGGGGGGDWDNSGAGASFGGASTGGGGGWQDSAGDAFFGGAPAGGGW